MSPRSDVIVAVAVFGEVVGDKVVVSRHPPNQPYLTHDVDGGSVVDVDVEELVELVVVVSSRHPNLSAVCPEPMVSQDITYPTIQASCKL